MHPSPYPICPFGSFCTLYKLKLNCGIHVQGVGRVLDRGGWFTMETVCHLSWAMECYISAADRWLTYIYSTLHPITSVLVLTSSKTTHWHTVCGWKRINVVYFRAVYKYCLLLSSGCVCKTAHICCGKGHTNLFP